MGLLINLVLDGKPALVVGGGEIAGRKAEDLLQAKARVTLVAPSACARVRAMAGEGRIAGRWKAYERADLDGAFLVVAATDDESVNARVAADAQVLGVLVNVVDRPALCTFFMPAIVRRGDLAVAVATEGRCPALASVLREELESRYGSEFGPLVDLLGDLRTEMIARGWDGPRIREAVARIYAGGIQELIASGDRAHLREFLRTRLGPDFPLPNQLSA